MHCKQNKMYKGICPVCLNYECTKSSRVCHHRYCEFCFYNIYKQSQKRKDDFKCVFCDKIIKVFKNYKDLL